MISQNSEFVQNQIIIYRKKQEVSEPFSFLFDQISEDLLLFDVFSNSQGYILLKEYIINYLNININTEPKDEPNETLISYQQFSELMNHFFKFDKEHQTSKLNMIHLQLLFNYSDTHFNLNLKIHDFVLYFLLLSSIIDKRGSKFFQIFNSYLFRHCFLGSKFIKLNTVEQINQVITGDNSAYNKVQSENNLAQINQLENVNLSSSKWEQTVTHFKTFREQVVVSAEGFEVVAMRLVSEIMHEWDYSKQTNVKELNKEVLKRNKGCSCF